jgi:lipoprotein-anchoring transpeptidase ErfK/SrfK
MIPSPLPEPIPLLQAASMDTVMAALVALPQELRQKPGLHVVMLRERRRLLLLESGALLDSFPVAIGMPGWETPTGRFKVQQKIEKPVWVHPVSGDRVADQSSANPLGSHWIGFHRDCRGRDAHDGDQWITIKGCTSTGFHGTPHRWTVGRAVSHGCVRLWNENVRTLYGQVKLGTPVTVLP